MGWSLNQRCVPKSCWRRGSSHQDDPLYASHYAVSCMDSTVWWLARQRELGELMSVKRKKPAGCKRQSMLASLSRRITSWVVNSFAAGISRWCRLRAGTTGQLDGAAQHRALLMPPAWCSCPVVLWLRFLHQLYVMTSPPQLWALAWKYTIRSLNKSLIPWKIILTVGIH